MKVKKSNGIVYGADLNATEKRALDMEIRRQLAEYTRNHELEIEALVVRQLKQLTGWGEKRLKRFYDGFSFELDKLFERYEMPSEDTPWLCMRELKEEGIDIEQWYKDRYPNEKFEISEMKRKGII